MKRTVCMVLLALAVALLALVAGSVEAGESSVSWLRDLSVDKLKAWRMSNRFETADKCAKWGVAYYRGSEKISTALAGQHSVVQLLCLQDGEVPDESPDVDPRGAKGSGR